MVIPTGAMGNLTGGYMAKQMGVPIGMMCASVNINGKCYAKSWLDEVWKLSELVISTHYFARTIQILLTG